MSEWKECTLGEVLNLRRGYDLPHSKMIEGIIPVAGSNGIIGTHNIATDIEPCITVGRSGTAGSTFFMIKRGLITQLFILMILKVMILNIFITYY